MLPRCYNRAMKKQPAKRPQPTRTSTVSLTINGTTYQTTATDRLEALAAIVEAALAERTSK